MPINHKVLVLLAFGVTIPLAVLGADEPVVPNDTGRSDPPVDVCNRVRGTCARKQVSTERGCVTPPRIRKRVEPRFPKWAREGLTEGKVTLGVTVENDGTVGRLQIVESTKPGVGFEAAALEAVQQWKYRPADAGGTPIRAYFTVTVEFTYR